jgi:hypothetical protein
MDNIFNYFVYNIDILSKLTKMHGMCRYRCLIDVFKMSETETQIAQKRGLKSFDFNKAIRVLGRDRAF